MKLPIGKWSLLYTVKLIHYFMDSFCILCFFNIITFVILFKLIESQTRKAPPPHAHAIQPSRGGRRRNAVR